MDKNILQERLSTLLTTGRVVIIKEENESI